MIKKAIARFWLSWLILFIVLIIAAIPSMPKVTAAINPAPAFCENQGYIIETTNNTEYCIFDSKTKCEINTFFRGECGVSFVREFPCVKEGKYIFTSFESCCSGLEPYLPKGLLGQETCQKVSIFQKIWDQIRWWIGSLFQK